MNLYPFEAFGVIGPIMSMPHIENSHGIVMTHDMQIIWRYMNLVCINLAFMAFSRKLNAIIFQRQPIIFGFHDLS